MPFRQFGRGEDVGRAITQNTRWHVEWASGKTRILSLTLDLKIIPGSRMTVFSVASSFPFGVVFRGLSEVHSKVVMSVAL